MAKDPRDVRDEAAALRKFHLEKRRQSGEALAGGRSRSALPISSRTGLAETETIALAAVNAFTTVTSTTPLSPSGYGPPGSVEVENISIVGAGTTVSVTFTDSYLLTVTPPINSSIDANYFITLTEALSGISVIGFGVGAEVFSAVGVLSGWTDSFTERAESPYITFIADLKRDVEYELSVTLTKNRGSAGDNIGIQSLSRKTVIQEVKR